MGWERRGYHNELKNKAKITAWTKNHVQKKTLIQNIKQLQIVILVHNELSEVILVKQSASRLHTMVMSLNNYRDDKDNQSDSKN